MTAGVTHALYLQAQHPCQAVEGGEAPGDPLQRGLELLGGSANHQQLPVLLVQPLLPPHLQASVRDFIKAFAVRLGGNGTWIQ